VPPASELTPAPPPPDPPWRNRQHAAAEEQIARDARRLKELRAAAPGHSTTCAQFASLDLEAFIVSGGNAGFNFNQCTADPVAGEPRLPEL
jgi:hypothetical protein